MLLEFKQFPTPHTGNATAALLIEVTKEWDVARKVKKVAKDSAFDVCKGVALLRNKLIEQCREVVFMENFHLWCIAHVVSIAVK